MIICVTGTPGTGKTELAKELAKKLNHKYIDVNKVIDDNDLKEEYEEDRKTYVVDEEKLSEALLKLIEEGDMVIDSHMSHVLPAEKVDWCIVTKCNPKALRERLEKRGYHKEKIEENVEAEIMDICKNEAEEAGHKLIILDTTKKSVEELVKLF